MAKKKSINPLILRFTKKSATPIGPQLIQGLPTEIVSQILEQAIDPTATPMQARWQKINQAIVCRDRDWYPLRKERTKFVLISTGQIKRMVDMVKNGEIDVEGVKELIISFANHQGKSGSAKSDAVRSIVQEFPRVQRSSINLSSYFDTRVTSESELSFYTITAMSKLNLKYFSCTSKIDATDLMRLLPSWTALEELKFQGPMFFTQTRFPNFSAPLKSLVIYDSELSSQALEWLTKGKPLNFFHLRRYSTATMKSRYFKALENILLSGLTSLSIKLANGGNLRALLLKENKLKHLAVHLEDFPGAIPLENLKQLETLTINFSVKEASSVDDFLDEFEKRWLGPIVFPYAIKIELMVDARKNALEYTEDHSVFAMAAQKGITLELTQRNQI